MPFHTNLYGIHSDFVGDELCRLCSDRAPA